MPIAKIAKKAKKFPKTVYMFLFDDGTLSSAYTEEEFHSKAKAFDGKIVGKYTLMSIVSVSSKVEITEVK